jgi:hypothetical protein
MYQVCVEARVLKINVVLPFHASRNHLVPKNEINTRIKALNKYNSELKTQVHQIKTIDRHTRACTTNYWEKNGIEPYTKNEVRANFCEF